MPRIAPRPRPCRYYGTIVEGQVYSDGTWLEDEALCYPAGGMTRRAYALFSDGHRRVARCGIPDTFFTIPARAKVKGKTINGFLSSDDNGVLKFTATL